MGTALIVQGYVETETEWESKHTIPEKGVVERHSKKGEIPVTEGSPKNSAKSRRDARSCQVATKSSKDPDPESGRESLQGHR